MLRVGMRRWGARVGSVQVPDEEYRVDAMTVRIRRGAYVEASIHPYCLSRGAYCGVAVYPA